MISRQYRGRLGLVLSLMLLAASPGVFATDAASIARQGNGKGAAPCQSCHAPDGAGQAAPGFPRLAGMDAAYLRAQLDAFAAGTRENPIMNPTAKALSEGERQAMAEYYSKLPVPVAPAPAASTALPSGTGAELATRGRWSQQVPACEQCHGPGGIGVGANFPPLAGQSANYIASQLKAFRAGTRHNDALGLMQHVSKALSDDDIHAVAAWFAAQPAHIQGSKP